MNTRRNTLHRWLAGLAMVLVACATGVQADPPGRVARLGYLQGAVSFQAAGTDVWVEAQRNRPLFTGDMLYTDHNSRAELDIGAATIRLASRTSFNLLNLDDNFTQIELTEGILNLRVHRVYEGQAYEIDTPTLAFVITRAGDYRIDISPRGDSTMVTVFDGDGDVYGLANASYRVQGGRSYRFHDSELRDYEIFDLPRPDEFDRWVAQRNRLFEGSVSRRYVADDMIGYADLDAYGSWRSVNTYGNVWFPTRVDTGWAPYRSGRWSWIDPWGWTWIDSAPWGFAPFHYGRWAHVNNRWGWVPGPRNVRPIYAPALVAFVGGSNWGLSISSGSPVGWFPLGPREVYVPWYQTSRNYFTNVNVRNTTIVNNTYITNVYNNYSSGRPIDHRYQYRTSQDAVTAVSRDAFVNARAVNVARLQLDQRQLSRAPVMDRMNIEPQRGSFVASDQRARATPAAAVQSRRVIAHREPPARQVPVQQRIAAISRNDGRPLDAEQSRELRRSAAQRQPAEQASRVRVVGRGDTTTPAPLPARAMSQRAPSRGDDRQPVRATDAGSATTSPSARAGQVRSPAMRTDDVRTPAARQPARTAPAAPRDSRATPPAARQPATRGSDANEQRSRQTISAPAARQPARTAPTAPRDSRAAPPEARQPATRGGDANEQRARQTISAPAARQPARTAPTAPRDSRAAPPEARQPATRGGDANEQRARQTISAPAARQPARTAPTAPRDSRAAPPPSTRQSAARATGSGSSVSAPRSQSPAAPRSTPATPTQRQPATRAPAPRATGSGSRSVSPPPAQRPPAQRSAPVQHQPATRAPAQRSQPTAAPAPRSAPPPPARQPQARSASPPPAAPQPAAPARPAPATRQPAQRSDERDNSDQNDGRRRGR